MERLELLSNGRGISDTFLGLTPLLETGGKELEEVKAKGLNLFVGELETKEEMLWR
jgi:hypothetical protein